MKIHPPGVYGTQISHIMSKIVCIEGQDRHTDRGGGGSYGAQVQNRTLQDTAYPSKASRRVSSSSMRVSASVVVVG